MSTAPSPQSAACDRCSQGVMDGTNPHLWGDCDCECHDPPPNCPGMGLDDLCTWPNVEDCGLCVIGKNSAVYGG